MISHPTESILPAWLEQAWLERYLDRGLTEAECEWFEIYLIQYPHLIDALDADNQLRDALHAQRLVESSGASEPPAQKASAITPAATQASSLATPAPAPPMSIPAASTIAPHPTRRRYWRPIAAAASLAVAALLGAAAANFDVIHPPATTAIAPVSPRRLVFDMMRGETTMMVQPSLDSPDTPLLIEIALPPRAESVVVHLADQSELPLKVSDEGFVSLLIQPRDLTRLSPVRLEFSVNGRKSEKILDITTPMEERNHGG